MRAALTAAMKVRDQMAMSAIRSALVAIDKTEAVDAGTGQPPDTSPIAGAARSLGGAEVPRSQLSLEDLLMLLRTEVSERRAAAAEYERRGRADQAARVAAEARILAGYAALR